MKVPMKKTLKDMVFTPELVRSIVHLITIYPSEKRFTARKNEVVIRAEVNIFNQIFNLIISNRSNEVLMGVKPTLRKGKAVIFTDDKGLEQTIYPFSTHVLYNSWNPLRKN